MIGFKISINNEALFTAGHDDALNLDASVTMFSSNDVQLLSTFATYVIDVNDSLPKVKQAFWEAPQLQVGDEVSIVVVNIENPSPATNHFDYGVKAPPYKSDIQSTCHFCGATENENPPLFERASGKICASCVKFYNKIMERSNRDSS